MLETAELDEWTALGRSRAPANAPYAGELTPRESWQLIESVSAAQLVDVRTPEEWAAVGLPKMPEGRSVIRLPWRHADGSANPDFLSALGQAVSPEAPALFLCRVGGRSFEAANMAARLGYQYAFNVTYGFEGEADASGARGAINGWTADGLPREALSSAGSPHGAAA